LHGVLLIAPLAALGLLRHAVADPAVLLFLITVTGFYLSDLPTLAHAPALVYSRPLVDNRRSHSEAAIAAVLLLGTFWIALVERAAAGNLAPWWSLAMGGPLMLAGVAVRAVAVVTLGRGFITEPRVAEGGVLVVRGVYAWVRHPSESGNLAVALGACLLLVSPVGLLVTATAVMPLTLWRVRQEERLLADAYGPRFRAYARRVKRLIPGVC
jgi:protein-S-isoprenylcysteine O-methyltransferase Ste14